MSLLEGLVHLVSLSGQRKLEQCLALPQEDCSVYVRSAMSQLSCLSAAALSDSWVIRSGVCADFSAGMLQGACCLC